MIASHAAAPLLGYIARGDTTVADAYLSPVLLRYTKQFFTGNAGKGFEESFKIEQDEAFRQIILNVMSKKQ